MGCEAVKCDIQLETLDGVKQFEGVCVGRKLAGLIQQEHDWGSTEKREGSKCRRWWKLWWGAVWQGTFVPWAPPSVSVWPSCCGWFTACRDLYLSIYTSVTYTGEHPWLTCPAITLEIQKLEIVTSLNCSLLFLLGHGKVANHWN